MISCDYMATYHCTSLKTPPGSCGVVAVSICLHVLGVPVVTRDVLRDNPPHSYGANFQELTDLVKSHGCFSKSVEIDAIHLLRNSSLDCPAIFLARKGGHFYVTTGYASGGRITVYEPTYLLKVSMSFEEFERIYGHKAILVARRPLKDVSYKRGHVLGSCVLVVFTVFIGVLYRGRRV